MKRFLFICFIVLMASTQRSSGSIVDLSNGEDGEMHLSVVSSKTETTYSGKLGFKADQWGYRYSLTQQYKSGEKFCSYAPVLGMRNFTASIMVSKFWDADIEVTLEDSEGVEIAKGAAASSGKRLPHVALYYKDIPRPDIVALCVLNHGTTKTVNQHIFLTAEHKIDEVIHKLSNISMGYNITGIALGRVESRLNEIAVLIKGDESIIVQDYFRLMAIADWVDRRCIINSLLMLFCCGGCTALIRRWFGAPRSTV